MIPFAHYGAAYQKGTLILERSFFLRDNIIDITYKLDKKAIVHANTVRAVCGEFLFLSACSVIFLFNETC